jgi:hypothetical protein
MPLLQLKLPLQYKSKVISSQVHVTMHIINSSTTSQDDHMKLLFHSLSIHKNCVEENSIIETKWIKVINRESWITNCSCLISSLVSLGHAYRSTKIFLPSSHHHRNNCKLATSQNVKNHNYCITSFDLKSIS